MIEEEAPTRQIEDIPTLDLDIDHDPGLLPFEVEIDGQMFTVHQTSNLKLLWSAFVNAREDREFLSDFEKKNLEVLESGSEWGNQVKAVMEEVFVRYRELASEIAADSYDRYSINREGGLKAAIEFDNNSDRPWRDYCLSKSLDALVAISREMNFPLTAQDFIR